MELFYFSGTIPPSKSLLNRALIIQQFNPQLKWDEFSDAKDVVFLKQALADYSEGKRKFYCGEGGTTFRFLSLFLSRYPGVYEIQVEAQLSQRPHQGLIEFFQQVHVQSRWEENVFILESQGWQADKAQLTADQTSQIASAILLSLWKLPQRFQLIMPTELYEYEYFQMTLQLNKSLGFKYTQEHLNGDLVHLNIPMGQVPHTVAVHIEPDVSSCFPLAVLGALSQPVYIQNFPLNSWQPDYAFLQIFSKAKVAFDLDKNGLKVFPSQQLQCFETDITQAPDLFPVLCVFASFCQGQSVITGLSRLAYKESDRLHQTLKLLQLHGVSCHVNDHKMVIEGTSLNPKTSNAFELQKITESFHPMHDHRMAMAAIIFQVMGSRIQLHDIEVLQKSFPEFVTLVRPLMPKFVEEKIHGGLIE